MKSFTRSIKYNRLTAGVYRTILDRRLSGLRSMIFLATTGRSATLSLERIFNAIPGCHAEHEPYPSMHDDVLYEKSHGNDRYARDVYYLIKSINLRRAACGYRHYLEANHLFIKTYIEYAVEDFGDKVKIIHLVRDPLQVANSIYALQDYPGTEEGNRWWLDHTAPDNRISIANILEQDPEFSHPFYRCLWYWYEVETRTQEWRHRLPSTPFIDVRTTDLNKAPKVYAMLDSLGIGYDRNDVDSVVATHTHSRRHQKKSPPLPIDSAETMHGRFKDLLTSRGYSTDFDLP